VVGSHADNVVMDSNNEDEEDKGGSVSNLLPCGISDACRVECARARVEGREREASGDI